MNYKIISCIFIGAHIVPFFFVVKSFSPRRRKNWVRSPKKKSSLSARILFTIKGSVTAFFFMDQNLLMVNGLAVCAGQPFSRGSVGHQQYIHHFCMTPLRCANLLEGKGNRPRLNASSHHMQTRTEGRPLCLFIITYIIGGLHTTYSILINNTMFIATFSKHTKPKRASIISDLCTQSNLFKPIVSQLARAYFNLSKTYRWQT